MTLVNRIKEKAGEKGLSIKALEEKSGLGNGTIRRWDDNSPSVDKLMKVANLLNLSLDYLVTGHEHSEQTYIMDKELCEMFAKLPPEIRAEFKGEIKGYLRRMNQEESIPLAK